MPGIMQAPVAFGLATYLMNARWTWERSRRAVLLFAATSPLVALATYAAIAVIPSLSSEVSCMQRSMLLLQYYPSMHQKTLEFVFDLFQSLHAKCSGSSAVHTIHLATLKTTDIPCFHAGFCSAVCPLLWWHFSVRGMHTCPTRDYR
jgi:hypothetical protein